VPLSTVAVPLNDELPPSAQVPDARTSSVLKLTKLLFAAPVPCRISALVPIVLPDAAPMSTEPVCKVSVLLPLPVNRTEYVAPVMVPALVTVPAVPSMLTPIPPLLPITPPA
jgi:hypothetical protein